MDQIEIAIMLLTVLVTILSLVLIVLLALVVVVLNKVNKVVEDARQITDNLSSATAWLSPTTIFSAAVRAFRK